MECCYFLSDARRVLKSYEIYAAILGVAVSLYFSLENRGLVNGNVLYTYVYATEMSGMMIAYVFCAFPGSADSRNPVFPFFGTLCFCGFHRIHSPPWADAGTDGREHQRGEGKTDLRAAFIHPSNSSADCYRKAVFLLKPCGTDDSIQFSDYCAGVCLRRNPHG